MVPAVQIGIALLGLFWIGAGLIQRYAHPPRWVEHYRGRVSGTLSQPMLGLVFVGMAPGGQGFFGLPDWVGGVFGLVMVAGFVAWVFGSVIYFPRSLLPRWYRAAQRAGVDVRSPEAVEAFRRSRH